MAAVRRALRGLTASLSRASSDLLLVVGLLIIAGGCWMVSRPAGVIVLGAELTALGIIRGLSDVNGRHGRQ